MMATYTQWIEALTSRFPSTDIETRWDIAPAIYAAYESGAVPALTIRLRGSEAGRRDYLGASMLGSPCRRRLWVSYRGGAHFEGRILRLFSTGDAYEARMAHELQAIGFEFGGDQSRFEAWGGRVAGHTDGFVRFGDLPWALFEAKTSNRRRYNDLTKKMRDLRQDGQPEWLALEQWEPKYWTQIHVYMAAFEIDVCLYMVTCKDTDSIVGILIPRDDSAVTEAQETARVILTSLDAAPPRGYARPQQPQCTRFCDNAGWCWYDEPPPRICAMCRHWRHGHRCALGGDADTVCDSYSAVSVEGARISWMDI